MGVIPGSVKPLSKEELAAAQKKQDAVCEPLLMNALTRGTLGLNEIAILRAHRQALQTQHESLKLDIVVGCTPEGHDLTGPFSESLCSSYLWGVAMQDLATRLGKIVEKVRASVAVDPKSLATALRHLVDLLCGSDPARAKLADADVLALVQGNELASLLDREFDPSCIKRLIQLDAAKVNFLLSAAFDDAIDQLVNAVHALKLGDEQVAPLLADLHQFFTALNLRVNSGDLANEVKDLCELDCHVVNVNQVDLLRLRDCVVGPFSGDHCWALLLERLWLPWGKVGVCINRQRSVLEAIAFYVLCTVTHDDHGPQVIMLCEGFYQSNQLLATAANATGLLNRSLAAQLRTLLKLARAIGVASIAIPHRAELTIAIVELWDRCNVAIVRRSYQGLEPLKCWFDGDIVLQCVQDNEPLDCWVIDLQPAQPPH